VAKDDIDDGHHPIVKKILKGDKDGRRNWWNDPWGTGFKDEKENG
jgi:hypothetical protein